MTRKIAEHGQTRREPNCEETPRTVRGQGEETERGRRKEVVMAEMTEATPVFEQDLDVELAKRLENMRDEDPAKQMVLFHQETKQIKACFNTVRGMLEGSPPRVTHLETRRAMASELTEIAENIRRFAHTIKPG